MSSEPRAPTLPAVTLRYDQVTLVCRVCKAEHVSYPDRALSTPELVEWLKTKVVRFCDCAVDKCDVKCRIKESAST